MNSKNLKPNRLLLLLLIGVGFVYAGLVSFRNFAGDLCPAVGPIPICYIVFVAYSLMLLSLVIKHNGCKHYFFTAGWGMAFVFAFVGSLAEFFVPGGGVCPTTSGGSIRGSDGTGIPMCYISLALVMIILILFLRGPYRDACEIHNAKSAA